LLLSFPLSAIEGVDLEDVNLALDDAALALIDQRFMDSRMKPHLVVHKLIWYTHYRPELRRVVVVFRVIAPLHPLDVGNAYVDVHFRAPLRSVAALRSLSR
jgi:hypothetical protein